jgi:hypothetical protein
VTKGTVATELQHRRRLERERLEQPASDQEHIRVDPMQTPHPQSMLDATPTEAGPQQLGPMDQPALRVSNPSDLQISVSFHLFWSPN